MKILLAGILGGIAMFIWTSVAHMFLPLGEAGIGEIPNESAVLGAMQSNIGDQTGLYIFPGPGVGKNATRQEKNEAMKQEAAKMASGPSGLLIYNYARPFAFAGLWERWKDPATGSMLESCTIVTTNAAESIRKIHERMPVVLEETDWDRWTDTAFSDTGVLSELLRPCDPKKLEAWPVGREVNAPKNQGPELIAAAD